MSTGSDRQGWSQEHRAGAGRAAEIDEVPSALYTLRAIVLGVAAVVGMVGVLAFVRVPETVPGPAEAAADFTPDGLISQLGCAAPCAGRAAGVQELDALPVGLDVSALDVVAQAEPEPPMAATPPPTTGGGRLAVGSDEDRSRDRDGRGGNHDDRETDDGRDGAAKAPAGDSPAQGHGKGGGKDRDDGDKDDD